MCSLHINVTEVMANKLDPQVWGAFLGPALHRVMTDVSPNTTSLSWAPGLLVDLGLRSLRPRDRSADHRQGTVPLGRFSIPSGHRRCRALSRQRRGRLPDWGDAGGRRGALRLSRARAGFGFSLTGSVWGLEAYSRGVGKAWISLDSLVRIEPFQGLTREFRRSYCHRRPPPGRPVPCREAGDCRRGG
jgi:hypothetical protein